MEIRLRGKGNAELLTESDTDNIGTNCTFYPGALLSNEEGVGRGQERKKHGAKKGAPGQTQGPRTKGNDVANTRTGKRPRSGQDRGQERLGIVRQNLE